MKLTMSIFASAIALCACAANSVRLVKGANDVPFAGQILAVEGATIADAQGVTGTVTYAATEYTNAFKTVTTPRVRYDFTITNYDGAASIATNCFDRFDGALWATNVSWIGSIVTNTTPWTTNWVTRDTRLISSATKAVTNIAEIVTYKARGETKTVTSVLFAGSATDGLFSVTPASAFYLGGVLTLDCGEYDQINLLIK